MLRWFFRLCGLPLESSAIVLFSSLDDVPQETKLAMMETVWKPLGYPDACEMENAAVAQICKAYDVPYLSVRALSDVIEGDANEDFGAFCEQAATNTFPIIEQIEVPSVLNDPAEFRWTEAVPTIERDD